MTVKFSSKKSIKEAVIWQTYKKINRPYLQLKWLTHPPTFVLVLQALLLTLCGLVFHVLLFFSWHQFDPLFVLFSLLKRSYNSINDPFYVSFESKLMSYICWISNILVWRKNLLVQFLLMQDWNDLFSIFI